MSRSYAAAGRRAFLRAFVAGSGLATLKPVVARADDGAAATAVDAAATPAEAAPAEAAPAAEAAAQGTPQAATQQAPQPAITPLEMQMLALVNGSRTSRGIPALVWDQTMTEVARGHAADMARTGVISHTGSDGSNPTQRLRRAGVQFQFGSENIWTYWGKVPDEGPATMHNAMMAEPHQPGLWNHIGNILYTGYRRIGVGIVVGQNGVQYLSEVFAD